MLEHLGNTTILYVDTAVGQLVVEDDGESAARIGDPIGLGFDPGRVHLFAADGGVL